MTKKELIAQAEQGIEEYLPMLGEAIQLQDPELTRMAADEVNANLRTLEESKRSTKIMRAMRSDLNEVFKQLGKIESATRNDSDGWNLDDERTWLTAFDPSDREQVRRVRLQAERKLSKGRTEEAIREYNRIDRYWTYVK